MVSSGTERYEGCLCAHRSETRGSGFGGIWTGLLEFHVTRKSDSGSGTLESLHLGELTGIVLSTLGLGTDAGHLRRSSSDSALAEDDIAVVGIGVIDRASVT